MDFYVQKRDIYSNVFLGDILGGHHNMGLCQARHLCPPITSQGKSGGALLLPQRQVPGVPGGPRRRQVNHKLVLLATSGAPLSYQVLLRAL